MRKILRLAVAACFLAGLFTAGSAITANATPTADSATVSKVAISGGLSTQARSWCCRLFKNQATGLWIDDSFEYGLRTFNYNASDFQKWNITDWNDQTHEMKNVATGRCIDDSVEFGLRAFPCNSTKFQSWYWQNWADGTTEFKNQATGRCMDNYYNLRAVQCDTSTSQSWW